MKIESFTRAIPEITNFIDKGAYAYTLNDLKNIFYKEREGWEIAMYRNHYDFITFLEENKILSLNNLNGYDNSEKRIWTREEAQNYDIGLTIKKGGYLSNYTAMYIHELTLQIPKTIYVSVDKYKVINNPKNVVLEQKNVDKAFEKKQRISTDIFTAIKDNFRFTFLYKKNNSINIGVTKKERFSVTDIERTLIDIAVRPGYSGGVFEVLEAYKKSKGKVDVGKIDIYLEDLNYIYPYHQLIGFYLEKAGFPEKDLEIFHKKVSHINFYLTYNLSNKKFDKNWKLYYPMGF